MQKQKEDEDGICFEVHLSKVDLGKNKHGKMVTTLVVDGVKPAQPAKMTAASRRPESVVLCHELLDADHRLADTAPRTPGFNSKPVRKVKVEAIRDALRERGLLEIDDVTGSVTDKGAAAFHRAKTKMIGEKKLIEDKRLIWRLV